MRIKTNINLQEKIKEAIELYKIPAMEIAINPDLPEDFFNQGHSQRSPEELDQWWNVPFIIMQESAAFGGVCYDVYCLDGIEDNKPTCHSSSGNLKIAEREAIELIRTTLSQYHNPEL